MRKWVEGLVCIVAAMSAACGGGEVTVSPKLAFSAPLPDTRWINDKGQTLEFNGVDAIHGFAGCNTYNASALMEQSSLRLGPLASTRMYCAGESMQAEGQASTSTMDSESRFFKDLESVAQWRLESDRLLLLDSQGAVLLSFQPKGL
jgi:heat shock protein HslJ